MLSSAPSCLVKSQVNRRINISRITLVVPNYEAAPTLFYLKYFLQRYMTCTSAGHLEFPMGISSYVRCNLCESIESQRETGLMVNSIYWWPWEILFNPLKKSLLDFEPINNFHLFVSFKIVSTNIWNLTDRNHWCLWKSINDFFIWMDKISQGFL